MKYIIEGRSVDKVLQENRIRIARGELIVTPLAGDVQKNRPDVPVVESEEVPEVPEEETAQEQAHVAPEQEVAPAAAEEENQQEQAPEVPEVPAIDDKGAEAQDDAKEVNVDDNKAVAPAADDKNADPENDSKGAPKKSTKGAKK